MSKSHTHINHTKNAQLCYTLKLLTPLPPKKLKKKNYILILLKKVSVLLSASVETFRVSRMRDFFISVVVTVRRTDEDRWESATNCNTVYSNIQLRQTAAYNLNQQTNKKNIFCKNQPQYEEIKNTLFIFFT